MAKFDVYGMGNALVDMEIEVTNDFLQKMEVEKGVMTLVEQERQDTLLGAVDGHQHKRTCGGSAANTIIAVAQMGGKSFYSCKVASDEPGEFYHQNLLEEGVTTNLCQGKEDGTTGKCMVFITPDADRTMNTYLGITANYSEKELKTDEIEQAKYLYIEGYLVTNPAAIAAVKAAKAVAAKNNVKTSLTFSDPGMVNYFRDGLVEMIGDGVDLIFCNESEALGFTDTKTVEEASLAMKKFAKSFAITRGPQGAFIWDGENQKEIHVLTKEVQAIDTNGAGDLFAGSFLYAITNGYSYGEAGRLACEAASQLVTKFGARLDKSEAVSVKEKVLG